MYYRRKLLLALLDVFEDNLNNTDCEKLLFNFCKSTGKNYYDFFPYRFGPFSFVSYYDKQRLTNIGLLKQVPDFQLNTKHSFFRELNPSDQRALLALKASSLRGEKLIRSTYQENPQFAARSEILERLFTPEEIEQLKLVWNNDQTPIVFTIGYEGLSIDAFLNKLIANNILLIVDVRNNPHSMKYGFSKKNFKDILEKVNINYIHLPELGIPPDMRKDLKSTASYKRLFHNYEFIMLPKREEPIKQLLDHISNHARVALVCFEADYHFCHRYILVEYLLKKNLLRKPVNHM
jgi:uncharacterized protein YeaO (DUF488 family)